MRLASFVLGLTYSAAELAQPAHVKIGMSMPQTGSLGAGGKAALLALQMWVDDVNAKGGLLGRRIEFIVYDDQTNPALTPGIYTKLLDVDKVDLIIAPYGDRKSTRLNSSHRCISYAVFCLKKKR